MAKITYIRLKNFSSIYTAMKTKNLEIDFTKCKNRVILLVGDNGTGKTSILSNLHPFAYPGSVDNRSSNADDIIRKDLDGYKEIHIVKASNLYKIKHYYTISKTGRNVKSFIEKDGLELNTNGNVTSFLELVQMEFGLEQEFLKLLRLGSNVSNFINMKAADRKSFLSKLLSDVGIYTQFFKKVNDDTRLLKNMIKVVSDKILHLHLTSEEETESELEQLNSNIKTIEEKKNMLQQNLWESKGKITNMLPDGLDDFVSKLNQNKYLLRNSKEELITVENKMKKVLIIGDPEKVIKDYEKEIKEKQSVFDYNKASIDIYFRQLNDEYELKETKKNELKYITSEGDYSRLNNKYIEMRSIKKEKEKIFKNYKVNYTKENLLSILALVQEINNTLSSTYEIGSEGVKKIVELLQNNENIDAYITKNIEIIDNRLENYNYKETLKTNASLIKNKVFVMLKPEHCVNNECTFIKFYKDLNNVDFTNDNKLDLQKEENRRNFFVSMLSIKRNIDIVLAQFKIQHLLIEKLPKGIINLSILFNTMEKLNLLDIDEKITDLIRECEEYEEYIELSKNLKELRIELDLLEKSTGSLSSLMSEIDKIEIKIKSLEKTIENIKSQNKIIDEEMHEINLKINRVQEFITLKAQFNKLTQQNLQLSESIEKEKNIEGQVNLFMQMNDEYAKIIINFDKDIKDKRANLEQLKFTLQQFKSLTEEQKILDLQYDEIEIIKESLSSNKGMPLLFMQLYLQNCLVFVNNLLETAFKGEIEVTDMKIDEREFQIPYVKDGIQIYDVSSASGGESSFISLALSFGLITQSIKDYNILLLDEIDAALSQKNRSIFLTILEKQLDMIGADQVFMITHNNMFDSYPVDLIITSDVNIDNYKNTNIIYQH